MSLEGLEAHILMQHSVRNNIPRLISFHALRRAPDWWQRILFTRGHYGRRARPSVQFRLGTLDSAYLTGVSLYTTQQHRSRSPWIETLVAILNPFMWGNVTGWIDCQISANARQIYSDPQQRRQLAYTSLSLSHLRQNGSNFSDYCDFLKETLKAYLNENENSAYALMMVNRLFHEKTK